MSSAESPLKARLLAAAAASGRGFETSEAQKAEVLRLIRELVASSPPPPDRADVDGDWELLWTDAPDILGLRGGPVANLRRIGQQIDTSAGTIENVIEYEPARWNPLVAPLGAQDDRVQQRVLLTFVSSGQRYELRLAGTAFRFETLLGVKLGALRRLEFKGPFDVPFGSFDLLYNDGSLRIVRTLQGFYSLNRKMGPEEGWDAAS